MKPCAIPHLSPGLSGLTLTRCSIANDQGPVIRSAARNISHQDMPLYSNNYNLGKFTKRLPINSISIYCHSTIHNCSVCKVLALKNLQKNEYSTITETEAQSDRRYQQPLNCSIDNKIQSHNYKTELQRAKTLIVYIIVV